VCLSHTSLHPSEGLGKFLTQLITNIVLVVYSHLKKISEEERNVGRKEGTFLQPSYSLHFLFVLPCRESPANLKKAQLLGSKNTVPIKGKSHIYLTTSVPSFIQGALCLIIPLNGVLNLGTLNFII
jgi:hypothetical protein